MMNIWNNNPLLRKVVFLHLPIVLSLYVLTDNDSQQIRARHLAVFTALARHPPSMRVFRGLFLISLLGISISLVLGFLETIVGRDVLDRLFFSVPYTLLDETQIGDDGQGDYELARVDENNDNADDEITDENEKKQEEFAISRSKDWDISRSPAMVISNMSLDLLLYILVALFFFTISSSAGGQYVDQNADNRIFSLLGDMTAPIFPLILFFTCAAKSVFPWTRRRHCFWTVIGYTLGAPIYDVQFRDGFIGDIFTSMVRPMQGTLLFLLLYQDFSFFDLSLTVVRVFRHYIYFILSFEWASRVVDLSKRNKRRTY